MGPWDYAALAAVCVLAVLFLMWCFGNDDQGGEL